MDNERRKILDMLGAGQIDAQEAADLLVALGTTRAKTPEEAPALAAVQAEPPGRSWARFWIFPAIAGAMILVLGMLFTFLIYATSAGLGWLFCGWPLALLGLGVLLLALWSRQATWMHIRVSEGEGQNFRLGFPVPLTLAAWVLRIIQPFVPQLKDTGVDDMLIALRDSASSDEPLFIDVQDDTDGERVQITLG